MYVHFRLNAYVWEGGVPYYHIFISICHQNSGILKKKLCMTCLIIVALTIAAIIVTMSMVRLDFSLFYSVSSSCISFLGPCILMLAIYIKARIMTMMVVLVAN